MRAIEDCTLSDGTDTAELGEILPFAADMLFARNADSAVNGGLNVAVFFHLR